MKFDFQQILAENERTYYNKFLIIHPFLRENSINLDDIYLKWEEAIIQYHIDANFHDLYRAFELHYFGLHFFAGNFIIEKEYFEKSVLPIITIIKQIPEYLLPESERLPKLIFESIIRNTDYEEFKVDAFDLEENRLSKERLIEIYDNYTCWKIESVDNNLKIINLPDSVGTKILWNVNEHIHKIISNYLGILDIIKL